MDGHGERRRVRDVEVHHHERASEYGRKAPTVAPEVMSWQERCACEDWEGQKRKGGECMVGAFEGSLESIEEIMVACTDGVERRQLGPWGGGGGVSRNGEK